MPDKKMFLLLPLLMAIIISCEKTKEFIYGEIVINEIMPVNSTIVADQNGEYDDWFELYNSSELEIDVSGCYLTDNKSKILKWQIPQGTIIEGKGYLIVWADNDTTQIGLHTNFKLSSLGEEVVLSAPDGKLIDEVIYPAQSLELSYSRNPDGTDIFKWQYPSFGKTNNDNK